VSNCRKACKGCGGGIYVKLFHCLNNYNSIDYTIVENLTIMHEKDFESLFVNLEMFDKWYFQPS